MACRNLAHAISRICFARAALAVPGGNRITDPCPAAGQWGPFIRQGRGLRLTRGVHVDNALTDESYWNAIWNFTGGHDATPAPPNEAEPTTKWRDQSIAKYLGPTRRFIEVGAGGSPWPAFVTKKYNAEAWGVDFSRPGLQLAAKAA